MVGIIHQVIRCVLPFILSLGVQTIAQAQLNTVRLQPLQLKTRPDSAAVIRICTPNRHTIHPLYVVDNVVISSTKSINPSDIERVDVVESKEAIRLYGKKGKNGVIRITMKQ